MKKILSILLALMMLFSVTAFAESGPGGTPPGGSTSSFEYTAATEITEAAEQADQTYTSDTVDESALIVNTTDAVTIADPTVTKTGDSDGGDNCNFYGLNAAVLVMGGTSTWTLTADTYITTFEGSMENVVTGGYTLYVNGIATN